MNTHTYTAQGVTHLCSLLNHVKHRRIQIIQNNKHLKPQYSSLALPSFVSPWGTRWVQKAAGFLEGPSTDYPYATACISLVYPACATVLIPQASSSCHTLCSCVCMFKPFLVIWPVLLLVSLHCFSLPLSLLRNQLTCFF